jgi:general secretion pathway protein G
LVRSNKQTGFTIVELLIVIVVIGILAAITIVAYNGIQQKARAATAQSDAANVAQLLAQSLATNGSYPNDLTTINNGGPPPATDNSNYQYHASNANANYCLTVTNGTSSYKISDSANAPTAGGCPGDGQGGVSAITNLATNPSVETGGTNWSQRWYGSGGSGTLSLTSAAAQYGGVGYRKTWSVGGGGQDIGMQYVQAVTGGKTYTFSAAIRASVTTGHKAFVQWYDASSTLTGTTTWSSEVSIPANTWQRLSVTATAPANAASATFVWGPYPASGSPASIAGQTIDFDGVMVTEGSTVYNYADGTTSNWIWNGAANASTSTGPPV